MHAWWVIFALRVLFHHAKSRFCFVLVFFYGIHTVQEDIVPTFCCQNLTDSYPLSFTPIEQKILHCLIYLLTFFFFSFIIIFCYLFIYHFFKSIERIFWFKWVFDLSVITHTVCTLRSRISSSIFLFHLNFGKICRHVSSCLL